LTTLLILDDGDYMANRKAFKREIQSYFAGSIVSSRRDDPRRHDKPTQEFLAWELRVQPETLSRKLNGSQSLNGDDIYAIGSTLIYWKRITRRTQLDRLFEYADYQLAEKEWLEEPWKYLIDDTQPLKPTLLPLHNASFENWKDGLPVKWQCNTKTGWVAPVPGREAEGGKALEVGGNTDNQEWVYCRTRETQTIPVVPGSKIKLSFWAKKTQEGKNPERMKFVEIAYYNFGWEWKFAQDITDNADKEWAHYETEWWDIPATVQKVAVGVVVYKDGAFHVDDMELHMRERV
jgi:hypothetical protein